MVVLEAMALRWLFGKAVTYLVAHGSTTALTSAGMHVAASILASVEGAGTLAGAAAVLHAQEPLVKAVWKGLKQRDGRGTRSSGRQREVEDIIAELANKFYAGLQHKLFDGSIKDDIRSLDPCTIGGCACHDYNDVGGNQYQCTCSHGYGSHSRNASSGAAAERWLLELLAAELYPSLRCYARDGSVKTQLREVDPCGSCDCPDYRQYEVRSGKGYCACGCKYEGHYGKGEWEWIIIAAAIKIRQNR